MNKNLEELIMKRVIFVLVAVIGFCFSAYAGKPKSFVKHTDGGEWSAIQIREDLSFDKAFNEILDVVAKRFEMDMISKEGAYCRSNWCYTWNVKGKYLNYYRARVVFKFSADRTKVEIKTEAEYLTKSGWLKGFDSRLLQTMKQDISGVVGRTVM